MTGDRGDRKGAGGPMLQATRLWRKQSAKGRQYLTGRLGGLRVLIFQRDPGDGQEGDHSHVMMLAAADERPAGGDAARPSSRARTRS